MAISELLQASERFATQFTWLTVCKFFDKVDSTQARVLQFLPKSGEGGVLIIGETQTRGVGRLGREWVSPPGGIWMTLALPMQKLTQAEVAPFSLVCALQLVHALREINTLECEIKWPNDILINGKKIGGILLSTVTKYKIPWLLIGIGINVNNPLPGELGKTATSIQIVRGSTQGRSRLIEAVLLNIWNAWQDFDKTGFGPYKNSVQSRLTGMGKAVKVVAGKKPSQGTMMGLDANGGLLLKSRSTTETIHAGEVVGLPV